MLRTLAVQNYRSLRRLVVLLTDLNVVTRPNGTGKSSLYRALRLLANASRNGAVAALAREGGLPATLRAGPEKIGRAVREGRYQVQGTIRTEPVALRLGFGGDDFGYAIDLGLPPPADTAFALDPEIKWECIWTGPVLRPSAVLCDRLGGFVKVRDDDGGWSKPYPVRSCDSMLSEFADPQRAPEVLGLRETIRCCGRPVRPCLGCAGGQVSSSTSRSVHPHPSHRLRVIWRHPPRFWGPQPDPDPSQLGGNIAGLSRLG